MKREEFASHLTENIIPFWNKMIDRQEGGFYGRCDSKGQIDYTADKGVILMNRILWFYSNAYILTGREELLEIARHQYGYVEECCYDHDFGGVYWSTTYDGKPADTTKHTYNQAFAIYALSTYYMASGDENSLNLAYEVFDDIEEHCCDDDGYLEAFDRHFVPVGNDKLSENGVEAGRTMNTLLHILEAYTVLYKADKDVRVRKRLDTILTIFEEKIYNPDKQYNEVFFDMDYNTLIDLQSYGHDIECSWLLDRALDVLGADEKYSHMYKLTLDEADKAYGDAFDQEYGCFYNEREGGKVDKKRVWWVQAESIIGLYNAYKKSNDEKYLNASEAVWNYVKNNIISEETGEWWEDIRDDNSVDTTQEMAHPWKGPYHNGRMCMEMMVRMESQE